MRARYTVLIEPTAAGYSAWVPDLPGCVATGATPAEVRDAIASALGLHLEGLHAEGLPVPAPERFAATVEVPIPPAVPAQDIRSAAQALIEALPEAASWDDLMEAIAFRAEAEQVPADTEDWRDLLPDDLAARWRAVPRAEELVITAVYQQAAEGVLGFVAEVPGTNVQGRSLGEARARLWEALGLVLQANRRLALADRPAVPVLRERITFEGWWPARPVLRPSPASLCAHFVDGTRFHPPLPPAATLLGMLRERPAWDELSLAPPQGEWPRMQLAYQAGVGFVVQCWADAASWSAFLATSGNFSEPRVPVDMPGGGEAWPVELFVPEAIAEVAVAHFLAEGQPRPDLVWVGIGAFPRRAIPRGPSA